MKIEVTQQKSVRAVALTKKTTMANLAAAIGEGYGKIGAYLAKSGVQMSDAPYVAYPGDMHNEFDLEMGFPVASDLPCEGEFYMTDTYEGKAVSATFKGPYSELSKAYGEVFKYIGENKLEMTGGCYDFYTNDPADTPPEELLTIIVIPIK